MPKKLRGRGDTVPFRAGKDSIAPLDLCAPIISKKLYAVYALRGERPWKHSDKYIPGLRINTQKTQHLSKFLIMLCLLRISKTGCMGARKIRNNVCKNSVKPHYRNGKEEYRDRLGNFGFKKSDNLTRRLQLMGYRDEAIFDNTKTLILPNTKTVMLKSTLLKRFFSNKVRGHKVRYKCWESFLSLMYCKTYHPNDYKR